MTENTGLLQPREMSPSEFLYSINATNGKPPAGRSFVLDVRNSDGKVLRLSPADSGRWFNIPADAIKSLTPIQAGPAVDPARVPARVLFQDTYDPADLIAQTVDGLAERYVEASARIDGSLRDRRPEPLDRQSVSLHWGPIYRGDCQMLDATLTFYDDGTGLFTSTVLTLHTHSGDVWHIHFDIQNAVGFTLFTLGQWDGPRMDDGNPPPRYAFNRSFVYNQVNFPAIAKGLAYSSC